METGLELDVPARLFFTEDGMFFNYRPLTTRFPATLQAQLPSTTNSRIAGASSAEISKLPEASTGRPLRVGTTLALPVEVPVSTFSSYVTL